MTGQDHQVVQTFEKMDRQLLETYARELQGHFLVERRLRAELEEKNRNLQQRLREIEALNRVLRDQINEYHNVAAVSNHVFQRLQQLAGEIDALAYWAKVPSTAGPTQGKGA